MSQTKEQKDFHIRRALAKAKRKGWKHVHGKFAKQRTHSPRVRSM